jgi:hypothetical protein
METKLASATGVVVSGGGDTLVVEAEGGERWWQW